VGAAGLPSRIESLRVYAEGSARFTFEDDKRGALAVGKLADLAALDEDYLTVPIEETASIASLLTMVGGRIAYGAELFERFEEPAPRD
jgi:predicted amidohydrolase YtcJ